MPQANLEAAFAGESQAHMKYLVIANKVEWEGLSNVARLFKDITYAEQVHTTNRFKALKSLGKTADKCPLCGAKKEKFVTF